MKSFKMLLLEKRNSLLLFSFEMCLIWFLLIFYTWTVLEPVHFSVHCLLSICLYILRFFTNNALRYSGKKKKRNGKQKGTSETKVYHIWETPLNFISLPQIPLSLLAKDSKYLKRGTPQYVIMHTQKKTKLETEEILWNVSPPEKKLPQKEEKQINKQ